MDKNQEKEYLLSLARSLMFDFPGEEADWIVKEFETIRKQLAVLDEVDTEGVEEATWPFEDETTYMRKDESLLFSTLWTVAHQTPLSMGILQAAILE